MKGFIDPENHRIKKPSIPAKNCRNYIIQGKRFINLFLSTTNCRCVEAKCQRIARNPTRKTRVGTRLCRAGSLFGVRRQGQKPSRGKTPLCQNATFRANSKRGHVRAIQISPLRRPGICPEDEEPARIFFLTGLAGFTGC